MIYITGATGFIGSRVAQRLLERGDGVRCLVRSRDRAAQLVKLGAELIEGDIAEGATHERGLAGATGAIHLAAIYELGRVDAGAMRRTNVEGTRAFLEAADKAGVPRIVHVSSTAALGPATGPPAEPRDAHPGPHPSIYHRTKAAAHELARAAQQNGRPVSIVCPAFVYGPGDEGPAGRFIDDLLNRRVPALLSAPAHFSYVFVDDVADGIIAALDRGTAGEVYILTGEDTDMNTFAARVTAMRGLKPPRLRLPVAVVSYASVLLDAISRATGLRFPITREAVRTTAADRWVYTHERATRDLDYRPRTLGEGLRYLQTRRLEDSKT